MPEFLDTTRKAWKRIILLKMMYKDACENQIKNLEIFSLVTARRKEIGLASITTENKIAATAKRMAKAEAKMVELEEKKAKALAKKSAKAKVKVEKDDSLDNWYMDEDEGL